MTIDLFAPYRAKDARPVLLLMRDPEDDGEPWVCLIPLKTPEARRKGQAVYRMSTAKTTAPTRHHVGMLLLGEHETGELARRDRRTVLWEPDPMPLLDRLTNALRRNEPPVMRADRIDRAISSLHAIPTEEHEPEERPEYVNGTLNL